METNVIPKIIHLTWFSGDEMPKQLKACVDTWKKVLPDFEIKVWDMKMARALNIDYVNEALDARKWAFAGDVVRAYAVWQDGGVYMDTDIWVLKRFDDLLQHAMVFFLEVNDKRWYEQDKSVFDSEGRNLLPDNYINGRQIQAAMFMGQKGQPCLKDIIDYYKSHHFVDQNGKYATDLISPRIYAKVLEKYGLRYVDENQIMGDIMLLNSSYVGFSKYNYHENAIALHLAAHAWDERKGWRKMKFAIISSPIGKYVKALSKLIRGY